MIFIIAFSITHFTTLTVVVFYNFTGAKPIDAKTFQVNYFQNNAFG